MMSQRKEELKLTIPNDYRWHNQVRQLILLKLTTKLLLNSFAAAAPFVNNLLSQR